MKAVSTPRCHGCGTVLDDRTAVRLDRAGCTFCFDCYLHRDVAGRTREEVTGSASIYHVPRSAPVHSLPKEAADALPTGPSTVQRQEQRGLWIEVGGKAVHLHSEFVSGADIKCAARMASDSLLVIHGETRSIVITDDDHLLVRPDDTFDCLPLRQALTS